MTLDSDLIGYAALHFNYQTEVVVVIRTALIF